MAKSSISLTQKPDQKPAVSFAFVKQVTMVERERKNQSIDRSID